MVNAQYHNARDAGCAQFLLAGVKEAPQAACPRTDVSGTLTVYYAPVFLLPFMKRMDSIRGRRAE
jgi:hypothetical protein